MARVLATTMRWGQNASWVLEQASSKQWIKEIIDGAMDGSAISVDPSSGLLSDTSENRSVE